VSTLLRFLPSLPPIMAANNRTDLNQHTVGHQDCPACFAVGRGMMIAELDIAHLTFKEASTAWLAWRESYRSKGTVANYRAHVSALKVFFGKLTLAEVQSGHVRSYQQQRLVNEDNQWACRSGASYINHECNTLKQMMVIAGEWKRIERYYQPLMLPKDIVQRVMTDAESAKMFEAASKDDGCYLAYLVASISNNTTATGAELRSLQLRHVTLDGPEPMIEIPHEMVKNAFRARRIPLNAEAFKMFRRVMERAQFLGCSQPTDYVFPLRVKTGLYDPTRPASASWLRKQWERLRVVSELPWVRPHDMRHQAITRMLEHNISEDAVRSVAGHVSQDILRRYSHQRYAAKRIAVDILGTPTPMHLVAGERRTMVYRDSSRDRMMRNIR
jgi:integrase